MAFDAAGIVRWEGAVFEVAPDPAGLDGLPVNRFGVSTPACVQLVDDQVYCHNEIWDRSSGWYVNEYSPVPPIRP